MKAAPAPPHAVFAASYLFAGVAALALVSAIGGFFAIPEFTYVQGRRGSDSGAGALAAFGMVGFALLGIVFAAMCLLLAVFTGRGSTVARMLTWVLGGLTVCFNVLLLAVGAYASVPWYGDLTRNLALAMLLFTAGAITLLALPASHRYFRAARDARAARRQQRWRPQPPAGGAVNPSGVDGP